MYLSYFELHIYINFCIVVARYKEDLTRQSNYNSLHRQNSFDTIKSVGTDLYKEFHSVIENIEVYPRSMYRDLDKLIQSHKDEFKALVLNDQQQKIKRQQQKLKTKLKLVKRSEKKDELIYLCGTNDNCIPVENSDILLKFIDNGDYFLKAIVMLN